MNDVLRLRRRAGMTQAQLAERAGTSQPAIAAYEAGRKTPTLRTLERLARAAGFALAVEFVPRLTREDRRSLALHEAVAGKVEADPDSAIARARRNLRLMREIHPDAEPLLGEWQRILELPVTDLLNVLRDPRPRARSLRHVSPFAGILSAPERTRVYRRFRASEARS